MKKPNLLFVDDEPRVLDGLRRMLHRRRQEWDLAFAQGGAEALDVMTRAPADVIVSDMRMPGMDGAELLSRVAQQFPDTIRFVLSGYSHKESAVRAAGTAHQFLSKPCTADELRDALTRAIRLKDQLECGSLREAISRMNSLPSLPSLYREVCAIAESPSAGMQDIAAVVRRDPGMSAKVLQLVNSSFFSLPRDVSDVQHALSIVGVEMLKLLIMTTDLFRSLSPMQPLIGLSTDSFWRHSVACGLLASRIIGEVHADRRLAEQAFTAGLLHDIGKLILATEAPERFQETVSRARKLQQTFYDAEIVDGGVSHADIGGYLLGLWRLPLPVVEAVLFHHRPEQVEGGAFNVATAVHVADALVQELQPGGSGNGAGPQISGVITAKLRLKERIGPWREAGRALCEEAASYGYTAG